MTKKKKRKLFKGVMWGVVFNHVDAPLIYTTRYEARERHWIDGKVIKLKVKEIRP